MKVIILAAGHGTRLDKDLRGDGGKNYRHLLGVPKPLLPVGGKALATKWMEILNDCSSHHLSLNEAIVVTNSRFLDQFQGWASKWPEVTLLNDGTSTNEDRLGAIGDIQFCIQGSGINDDLMIVGGDTLFYADFKLDDVLKSFYKNKQSLQAGALVLCYKCKDSETTKVGILELDECGKVTSFLEKPEPHTTSSRWADARLKDKDAPGNMMPYLLSRCPVYAVEISGRFDVGCLNSYIECDNHFSDQGIHSCADR